MKRLSEENFQDMSMLFTMFGDSTRLKILSCLFEKEMCVSDIAEEIEMSHSAISHQLSTLKKMRLVKSDKRGKSVFYSLNDLHIQKIFEMALEHIME